jgi:putative transposase
MPRPIRIHLPDLIYHIVNRGNNRQVVFAGDQDYRHYLAILKRYKEKFAFKIFAYCLMTNHIHLLIKTSNQGTVSDIVKAVTISHTRRHHYRYGTSGHLWQGRFKSPIVSDDEYVLTLMRYIEQNPVRAGIVDHPEKYLFSSYQENIKTQSSDLIDREDNPVFSGLGLTVLERIQRYQKFASALLDEEKLTMIRNSLGTNKHYASEKFLLQIQTNLKLSQKRRRGRPRQCRRITT